MPSGTMIASTSCRALGLADRGRHDRQAGVAVELLVVRQADALLLLAVLAVRALHADLGLLAQLHPWALRFRRWRRPPARLGRRRCALAAGGRRRLAAAGALLSPASAAAPSAATTRARPRAARARSHPARHHCVGHECFDLFSVASPSRQAAIRRAALPLDAARLELARPAHDAPAARVGRALMARIAAIPWP